MSDKYEIKGKLARGGVGAVFRAYDRHLGRDVALKRLLPIEDTQLNDSGGDTLAMEAKALASLSHPNIVTIFEFGEDEKGPFAVFELIEGDTLKKVIGEGALSEEDFFEVAEQMLDALVAAQRINILHRDIKPANIMLQWLPSGKFQVKILDFGLSKFTAKPSKQTLDQKGAFLGSIDFIAPEQIELEPLDFRTDLYSLGCVLYFSLTQKAPFRGDDLTRTLRNHLEHVVTPIGELRPDLSAEVGDWLMRLIERNADERPETAMQALEELETARRAPGGDSGGGEGEKAESGGKPHRLGGRNLAAAAAALVIIVLVAQLLLSGNQRGGSVGSTREGLANRSGSLIGIEIPREEELVAWYSINGPLRDRAESLMPDPEPGAIVGAVENRAGAAHPFHLLKSPDKTSNSPSLRKGELGMKSFFFAPKQRFLTAMHSYKKEPLWSDDYTVAILFEIEKPSEGSLFRMDLVNRENVEIPAAVALRFQLDNLALASGGNEVRYPEGYEGGRFQVGITEFAGSAGFARLWRFDLEGERLSDTEPTALDLSVSGGLGLRHYEVGNLYLPKNEARAGKVRIGAISLHRAVLTPDEMAVLARALVAHCFPDPE